jgi:hypothetical protein
MLTRTPSIDDAICLHEAAYIVAARVLDVALRPTHLDRGIRRYAGDVICLDLDDGSPEFLEHSALVMLCGNAALGLYAPTAPGTNIDTVEAGVLLSDAERRHCSPMTPSNLRHYHIQAAQLRKDAKALVLEHGADIIATAADLAAKA